MTHLPIELFIQDRAILDKSLRIITIKTRQNIFSQLRLTSTSKLSKRYDEIFKSKIIRLCRIKISMEPLNYSRVVRLFRIKNIIRRLSSSSLLVCGISSNRRMVLVTTSTIATNLAVLKKEWAKIATRKTQQLTCKIKTMHLMLNKTAFKACQSKSRIGKFSYKTQAIVLHKKWIDHLHPI